MTFPTEYRRWSGGALGAISRSAVSGWVAGRGEGERPSHGCDGHTRQRQPRRQYPPGLTRLDEPAHHGQAGLAPTMFLRGRVNPTSENYRKRTMGSVANKIAKKIISSGGSKVVDLASWREDRKMALGAGFGDDGRVLDKFADHGPCHAQYVVAENVTSLMAERRSVRASALGGRDSQVAGRTSRWPTRTATLNDAEGWRTDFGVTDQIRVDHDH